ncbi:hypothetical protein Tcan_10016 [Toxocara canis]|uniref:Uncharacterized protein n=2 Tax=Toxocara canis TaxID=6265 RepID=A0A0B2W2D7_TOXCA|nr:hypothetical protein Tcan_10016 [Toxocara canis]VDM42752.1 unnamed protein product [Toxocara canis]
MRSVGQVSLATFNVVLLIIWLLCIAQSKAYEILFGEQTEREQVCRRDMRDFSGGYLSIYVAISVALSLCFIAIATYLLMVVYVEAQMNVINVEEEVYQMMDAVMTSLIPTTLLPSLTHDVARQ